jgi:hypothetical protein
MLLFFKVFVAVLSFLTRFADTLLALLLVNLTGPLNSSGRSFPGKATPGSKLWVDWDSNPEPTPKRALI